jgi:hypothetical protein
MKQVFQANDGTIFEAQAECERYESKYESKSELFDFVDINIEAPYNDDAGYRIIETQNVVDFIEAHYEKIGEILGKVKVQAEDWIINTNTTERYPDTLKAGDYIEVVYSDGDHDQNIAKSWDYCWNTKSCIYIVKYRKVN